MAAQDMTFALQSKSDVEQAMNDVEGNRHTSQTVAELNHIAEVMESSVNQAVVSLQFQDMVTQLVSHVAIASANCSLSSARLAVPGALPAALPTAFLPSRRSAYARNWRMPSPCSNQSIMLSKITPSSRKASPAAASNCSNRGRNTHMAKTVLCVDDSASIRQMVGFTLKSSGYEVVEAVDGMDGLDKAKAKSVNLVLTDQNMPRMDGLTPIKVCVRCHNTSRCRS